uniref:Uncharacterized protein n=1 Tax=Anguilla anguilla TaxID=7936 RepID=A0A0E9UE12_ANGAN
MLARTLTDIVSAFVDV